MYTREVLCYFKKEKKSLCSFILFRLYFLLCPILVHCENTLGEVSEG